MSIGYKNKTTKNKKGGSTTGASSFNRSYGNRAFDDYDDDYDGGYYNRSNYGSGYRSNYGSGYGSSKRTYGSWNWGNYGAFGQLEEDDDELFIANHDSYFTPKTYEVENRMPWGQNLRNKDNVNLVKEMSRFFFYKMIDNKAYIDEHYLDETTMNDEQLSERDSKTPFYQSLWDKYVPGFTPLEKAINIFNELNQKSQERNGDGGERLTENMRSDIQEIDFHEDTFNDPEYNELLDMDFFKKKKFNKVGILNKISLIEDLGAQFKIEKDVTQKVVANSKLIAKKIMRDYSQVFNVDLYQRLFPDFKTKLATKNLTVNVPVEKTEHKQKIIILLDFSGSMSSPEKQEWVLAILINRLKYAMLEEAEVFFSYFCHDPNSMYFYHVKDRKSAIEFWSRFSTMPNGGDTYIGSMINRINDEINNKHRLMNLDVNLSEEKPEILIINDGQDTVKTKDFVYKTNAISLFQRNEELKKLCLKNRGKYVTVSGFDRKQEVITYSEQGVQKLNL